MGMDVIADFLQLDTIRIQATIRDDDDTLATPTAITLDLYDGGGTKVVDGAAMTLVSSGIYEYYYTTDADSVVGHWYGTVWVTDGTGGSAKVSHGTVGLRVR